MVARGTTEIMCALLFVVNFVFIFLCFCCETEKITQRLLLDTFVCCLRNFDSITIRISDMMLV